MCTGHLAGFRLVTDNTLPLECTGWARRKRANILDHKFHVLWGIFTVLVSVERGMNELQSIYKIYNFSLTVSLHYLMKAKNIKQHILQLSQYRYFITRQKDESMN